MGMKAFGVQGVIYGPLLVSTGTILFQLLNSIGYDKDNQLVFVKDEGGLKRSQSASSTEEK